MSDSSLFTDLDVDRDGKQFGYIQAPRSTNTAGWANLFIPLIVIRRGDGPTALLFGGNHGDEYEGPVTLLNLARYIQPEQVHGRIILVPALNLPAVQANTRLSPLDGRNMNRAFPGSPSDTITGQIAHFVSSVLIPLADVVVDIHSGGRSMLFLPSVNMHRVRDPRQMSEMMRLALAWGAPYVFIYRDVAGGGLLPGYAESLGKPTLGTEMGSASQYGPATLKLTYNGLCNVLAEAGILKLPAGRYVPAEPSQIVASELRDDYIMSPASGIFEPLVELGDGVAAGQPIGCIHFIEQPSWEPLIIRAKTEGFIISRRAIPLTQQGDCVAVVARRIA
ncbi:MAG: succinylglutamate desuccinylase/aspartoacylase family protein [Thermoflexales bacterium]|nr:succinylglutamate desuccinylase/aspartoacylase family protein [Thermoflexales bacterium]